MEFFGQKKCLSLSEGKCVLNHYKDKLRMDGPHDEFLVLNLNEPCIPCLKTLKDGD
jgi:hypothetical protein